MSLPLPLVPPHTGPVLPSCPLFFKNTLLLVYDRYTGGFGVTFPYTCIMPQIGSFPPLFTYLPQSPSFGDFNSFSMFHIHTCIESTSSILTVFTFIMYPPPPSSTPP
jgi:hypothetical protein